MNTLQTIILITILGLLGCKQQTSMLSEEEIAKRVDTLVSKMTLQEKLEYIGGYEFFNIRAIPRLGIPQFRMADGPVGVRNYGPSTAYPATIGLAASFNTELARKYGQSIAKEAKAKDVQIMLGPAMNIHRAPMCGRNFEYLGEDPFLAGKIASGYIQGAQAEGVMCTAKHFACNDQEFERNKVSSDVDERTLQEIYLTAFRMCVQEGKVGAVMNSYNLVNGVHASQNDYLLNQVLKKEWGFKGILMSDWESTYDGVAAANNGLDLEMPSGKFMNPDTLIKAIKDGRLKESTINDKIHRILSSCMRLGLFDTLNRKSSVEINKAELSLIALQAAREGIVLLKNNNNLLPLDINKIKTIAVLGPNASPAVTGGGGSAKVEPYNSVSVLDGIKAQVGANVNVTYHAGPSSKMPDEFYLSSQFYTKDGEPGLNAEYFSNSDFQGEPVISRIDKSVLIHYSKEDIEKEFKSKSYSVRWTGKIKVNKTGNYRVILQGNQGIKLFIDNKEVINKWSWAAGKPEISYCDFVSGKEYQIKIEHFQRYDGDIFKFGYELYDKDAWKQAIDIAAKADVAVVCVGYDYFSESEGSDRPYGLPELQEEFIKLVAAANKNTIVVLNAGGNTAIANWVDNVAALLHAWYPGQEGGTAIAEIIFGKTNPSGKLPISIEKRWEDAATYNSYYDSDNDLHVAYTEGVFLGYRHFDSKGIEPLFPFGFGLSYTTFEYSNLKLSATEMPMDGDITATVDVKNTGKVAGKESVQLYISDLNSSVPRPIKELKAFAKVDLQPGETKTVNFQIKKDALSFYDVNTHGWLAEPGEFKVLIGASSRDIRLKEKFALK